MQNLEEKKQICSVWFENLRNQICAQFEKIEEEYANSDQNLNKKLEKPGKFVKKRWKRDVLDKNEDGGGGEMSLMKGNVFEKVGVNISTVFGEFSEEFRKKIPGSAENGGKFYATGISLVAHMASPLVPAVHMNTRFIATSKDWFGGGADLNPMYENEKDTKDFHAALKKACDSYDAEAYAKYKEECDKYFFIKHRGFARGVGGIFYDYLNSGDFARDFDFTKNVGLQFLDIFPKLVRRNMFEPFSEEQREWQLKKRGYYAEFNLVYDRGTKFGLETGGNVEAILMSLPPVAKWE
jgi:coproporphyrinogen III oxidase